MDKECKTCNKLDYLKISVTYNCNLNCRFCQQQMEKKASIAWEDFKKTIEEVTAKNKLRLVILTGGEPLVWPHLNDAIKLCKERGVKEIGLFTNGVLLDEDKIKELKAIGVDWIRISIYGSTAEINDGFLPNPDTKSFDLIIRAIKNLKKFGFRRKVRVTIMKPNLNDVENIINKMYELEVEELDFRAFSPTNIKEIDDSYALTNDDFKKIIPRVLALKEKYKDKMRIKCLPGCYEFLFGKEMPAASSIPHCTCGKTYLGVTAEGKIRECFGVHTSLGHINKDDVNEIWEKSDTLKNIRKFEGADECSECIFLKYCKVSDCFAATFNRYGDFNHKNPLCPLDKPVTSVEEWEGWKSKFM